MTIMGEQGFNVPTIPPDLRREETILQIADSLEYLEKVANDIFTRISNRVSENRTRLQKVNDRVALAQARVDKLKGSNKATKVFASSKYPAENDAENYNTLFGAACVKDGLRAGKRRHYKVQSKHPTTDERVLREKLQFFNVHLNTKSRRNVDKGEGLGGLPRTVPSISCLLLFNTTENP
jgi:WAS family protein 1